MKKIRWLDALRGYAALSVLVAHFGVAFWLYHDAASSLARQSPLWGSGDGHPWFAKLLATLPVNFAALGVAAFFLLSGYVVAISLETYTRTGFVIGRATRLLPTYAAGFLITCGVVWLSGDPRGEINAVSVLAGLFPAVGPTLQIASPGMGIEWTLIVEVMFYAICFLAYRSITRRLTTILALGACCSVAHLLLTSIEIHPALIGIRFVLMLSAPFIPFMLVGLTVRLIQT